MTDIEWLRQFSQTLLIGIEDAKREEKTIALSIKGANKLYEVIEGINRERADEEFYNEAYKELIVELDELKEEITFGKSLLILI
jgi:hypothetical protein